MMILAGLLFACGDTAEKPRPSRFDQPEMPESPKPAEVSTPEKLPDPHPDAAEPEPEDDGKLKLGDLLKVPEISPEEQDSWRKTGGRTDVSQPMMPTARISPEQCEDLTEGGPLMDGDDCVTAEIKCEESIIGHTVGGIDRYDGTFYDKKRCWPNTKDHDSGHERVYRLEMPEGEWRAWATLYTPCADLDLAAVRHDFGGCPSLNDKVGPCEMTVHEYNRAERIELTTQTKWQGQKPVWYIIVEGKDGEEGPFELAVQCRPGVGGSVDP